MLTKKCLWKEERGVALVAIVLIILLTSALLMMALNISGIETNIASTHRRTVQGFQAAAAGVPIANQVLEDVRELNAIPTNPPNAGSPKNYPAGYTFDCSNSPNVGDLFFHDLVEEVRNGGDTLSSDSASVPLDLTAPTIYKILQDTIFECKTPSPPDAATTDPATRGPDLVAVQLGHTLLIDIDMEAVVNLAESELEEFGIEYHKKVSGAGCSSGTMYYIDVVAVGPLNTRSNVGSGYYKC